MNLAVPHGIDPRLRAVEPADVPIIVELVRGLARYEKAEHEAQMTDAQLYDALFGPSPALFGLVASERPGGPVIGFAVYFLNFSTWRGVHGIYLEDIYVEPQYRGHGLGKELLRTLAQIAHREGMARVEWSVLKWNTPSIDFYRSIGAASLDEWFTMRLTDEPLAEFGQIAG